MINVNLKLTESEAKLLKLTMEKAKDESDFRDQWKSQEMKNVEAKVISAVLLAEQQDS